MKYPDLNSVNSYLFTLEWRKHFWVFDLFGSFKIWSIYYGSAVQCGMLYKPYAEKSEPIPFVSSNISSRISSWSSSLARSLESDSWLFICCTIVRSGWSNIIFQVFEKTLRFLLKNGLKIISNPFKRALILFGYTSLVILSGKKSHLNA